MLKNNTWGLSDGEPKSHFFCIFYMNSYDFGGFLVDFYLGCFFSAKIVSFLAKLQCLFKNKENGNAQHFVTFYA